MDKYSALWLSYSKINQFQQCPRAYFLNNVYKNPRTGRKLNLISPSLALGQIVHQVIESLSVLPVSERFREPLLTKYNQAWEQVSGKKGGFTSKEEELRYKNRGAEMIRRILKHPGPIGRKAVKLKEELPWFWLDSQAGIILSGKIDWLEYLPQEDAVHIIDFKTSKSEEDPNSLQLPIYYLLATKTQRRPVLKASYWYLEFADQPQEVRLPDLAEIETKVLKIAQDIKLAHSLEHFKCPHGPEGCRFCRPFEKIIRGQAEYVGLDAYGRELYFIPPQTQDEPLTDSYLI